MPAQMPDPAPEEPEETEVSDQPVLTPVALASLPGWVEDDKRGAFEAFLISCGTLLNQPADRIFRPAGTVGDWHPVCRAAEELAKDGVPEGYIIRAFFENWFQAYEVTHERDGAEGLFTGYYEPLLKGAREQGGPYQTPIYARPADLITVNLGQFSEDFEGRQIRGRVGENQRLIPYADRTHIETQGLETAEVLVWAADPADVFFLHIQGSGTVEFEDGTQMRLGYAEQNGHAYFAIGRELIARGALTKETVSLQSIRAWMDAHPDQASDLMRLNPSYIFFRELEESGPVGAQGVPLTPDRSLAVDRFLYSYGFPAWVDIHPPKDGESRLRRLMVAQDTGGAIRGTIRGDVFWGQGPRAADLAGHMKSQGWIWIFLPKTVLITDTAL